MQHKAFHDVAGDTQDFINNIVIIDGTVPTPVNTPNEEYNVTLHMMVVSMSRQTSLKPQAESLLFAAVLLLLQPIQTEVVDPVFQIVGLSPQCLV